MNLNLQNYLFLSHYLPLPLSALKIIEKTPSHPFHEIKELKIQEIENELRKLNKIKKVSIRTISKKAINSHDLLRNSILDKISSNLEEWKELGITIIPYFNDNFPKNLKNINNPPKVLFVRGDFDFISKKAISIVGTRNPTEYGKEMAFKIGYRFAEMGFVVINGFAKGVDIEAIKGGLKAGGKIIGVLGSGLLNPYPKENLIIFNEVLKNNMGLFISEQLPKKNVTKSTLATRNRISSALSSGNIFIEGSSTSGTRWQLKYGKEQSKPTIVLKPKEIVKETELPRRIIKSEKNAYLIENLDDIDQIIENLFNSKRPKRTTIKDFI
jgi:DNA processing protein